MAKDKKNVSPARRRQNRVIFLCVAALVVTVAVVNIQGLADHYYDSFILQGDESAEAAGYLVGLSESGFSAQEQEELVQLRSDWDSWRYSRLQDEADIAAGDGTTLHGYYYDEGSDVTAIFLPRYYQDGTGDFLLGPYLSEITGCNILLPDPRAQGASGGEYYSYGYREGDDLIAWMDWADETFGQQTFLLVGEASGANAIGFAAAGGELTGRVAFAVAESPYASFKELAGHTLWESYRLPAFPFRTMMEWKLDHAGFGFGAEALELGQALAGAEVDFPVLVLTSAGDSYVPPEMTQTVAEALGDSAATLTGGSGHGSVYPALREQVEGQLANWWAELG